MKKKQLVDEMISLREEMRNINVSIYFMKNRIQISNSSRIVEYHSHQKSSDKIRKYFHKLIAIKPIYFSDCFISDKYIFEMLSNHEYEKLLQISLKFIVKFLQNSQTRMKINTEINSPTSQPNTDKINKMIKDIVSPIRTKIETQSQFYDQQLKNTHRACQTQPSLQDKAKHLNLAIRQQSSMLSSIQQESPNLNSPKFNENMINAIDDISFERSSIKKETAIKQLVQHYDIRKFDQGNSRHYDQGRQQQYYSESNEQKGDFNMSVVTTPKQQEFDKLDNYKQTLNTSNNSSFKDTKRKMKNKSLLDLKMLQVQAEKRFPKKDIPKTMLSVDFVPKRRKTPDKKRAFNIITNF